ncbi:auxin-responsive protein SAUR76 [Cynara cardunculus var. scolymus]|uniref:Auxin responsive SAUR protein n=1 Tax=Cynara cardunculus var. scolymus TaxID=59895 RepID=A0A124SHP9_CYNCS|nr:auxin-responsive protein SAUR76 [Cynara cardunculus var. scolymus]KVI10231.1 Auxin responsive SAUR protein [Cynara cardunculus var. scolymus]
MKKINVMLRKCKTLSKQLRRSSSNLSSGSKSARHHQDGAAAGGGGGGGIIWNTNAISVYGSDGNGSGNEEEPREIVFVGSTRKRYVISSKYLSHPLVNALIEKSKPAGNGEVSVINCEVVLFDHLLWMLENADFNVTSDCLDELADLYSS